MSSLPKICHTKPSLEFRSPSDRGEREQILRQQEEVATGAVHAGCVTATDCVFGRTMTCGKVAHAVLLTCNWFPYKSKATHHFRCLRVCSRLCGQWRFRASIGEVPDATRQSKDHNPPAWWPPGLVLKEAARNVLTQHPVSLQRLAELAEFLHFLTI